MCLGSRRLAAAMLMVLVLGTAGLAAGERLPLADHGRTAYQVVIPNRATAAQQHAAQELAAFLGEISGATFPVVTEAQWGRGPAIFVGLSASARRVDPQASLWGLGHDGLVIRTASPHLLLFGGEPRGTLYAVYAFLEERLGCRWWTSTASTIPRRSTIAPRAIKERQVPILEYREPFFSDAFDGDWAVRNRCNGASARLDGARGGKITYQGFVHTFAALVPPEQHFAQHPEWYSEIGGKRTPGYVQLCLTNQELKAFVAEQVKAWLHANPKANIVSVSQNDALGYCECANCKALDDKEGSHAGSLLHFVNYVAQEVGKEFPRVAIDTLAYTYTRKPPRYVRPEPNVIVRLCSIECNFARPLTDASNRSFYQDLVGWSKVSQRLYVWDYVTNFGHYLWPQPNVFVLGPNVQTFVTSGVRGIFEQGSYTTLGGDMALLKAWVLAKLLWNPNRDANALIREFLHGYYGPAGRHVGRYLELMHQDAVKHRYYLGCFVPADSPFPGRDTVASAEQAFQQAFRAVAGDGELTRRVRLAHLPLVYVALSRGPQASEVAAYQQAIAELEAVVAAEGISQLSEGGAVAPKVAEWRESLRSYQELAQIPPHQVQVTPLPAAWRFATDPQGAGEAQGWARTDCDDTKWAQVRADQGTGWETQGFPGYTGLGWYRQVVPMPAQACQHLYLHFGAVDEDAWVYVNGQFACEHSCASTGLPPEVIWRRPFACDIRPYVQPGQPALIAVKVNNRAFQGGIWQPVHLVATDRDLDPAVVTAVVSRTAARK